MITQPITLENEFAIDSDGWALVAPFGEHRKVRDVQLPAGEVVRQTFIQVMDEQAAADLLANENTILRRLRRAVVGIPVYRGHPDLREHAPATVNLPSYQDTRPLGLVDKIRKSARGLELGISLLPAGAAAVENEGCKYTSVLWAVKPISDQTEPDGAIRVRPYKLISVGLTQYPNISGVESLANARQTFPAAETKTQKNEQMKQLLIGWLAAQGTILANEATDQQVLEACQKLLVAKIDGLTTLGNERTALAGKVATLETGNNSLTTKLTEAQTALANSQTETTTVRTALTTERKGRSEALVDLAITQGKIALADRDARATVLANAADFAAEADKLNKEAVKHTTSAGKTSGDRKTGASQTQTPREQVLALANEIATKEGLDFQASFNAALKRNPALAEQLNTKPKA